MVDEGTKCKHECIIYMSLKIYDKELESYRENFALSSNQIHDRIFTVYHIEQPLNNYVCRFGPVSLVKLNYKV